MGRGDAVVAHVLVIEIHDLLQLLARLEVVVKPDVLGRQAEGGADRRAGRGGRSSAPGASAGPTGRRAPALRPMLAPVLARRGVGRDADRDPERDGSRRRRPRTALRQGGRGSGHQPGLPAASVGIVTRTYSTCLIETADAGRTAPPGPVRSETATRTSSSRAAGRRTSRNGSNSLRAAAIDDARALAAGSGSSRMTL